MSEDDFKSLSYDEKLKLIDNDLQDLHKYCVSEGFDKYTIERCAKPLLDMARKPRRERFTKRMMILGSIVVALFAIFYVLPEYKLFWVFCRLASIKMIPIYDWTDIINWDCLIDNPYFEAVPYNEDNCKICDDMDGIPRFSLANISADVVAEDYLKMNRPFILTDATDGWPARDKFSLKFIKEFYRDNNIVSEAEVCNFRANFKSKIKEPATMLDLLEKKGAKGYVIHWENCEADAAKQLRPFYKRPAAIPPMVEMDPSNWVVVSKQCKDCGMRVLPISDAMVMYTQLTGESTVRLKAIAPCNETCAELTTTLRTGESVISTALMWKLYYEPLNGEEVTAIATGGTFDY